MTLEIPRFDSEKTTAMTVIESSPSQTTLKVPFVVSNGTFDTGIAVANMSSGSSAQPGSIMLDFYVGGMKMTHRTSASSPGTGLNASGMLEPGGTYVVLLSELFPGNPGGGYMIITTDFTSGDGNIFISDFAGFSATGIVRVWRSNPLVPDRLSEDPMQGRGRTLLPCCFWTDAGALWDREHR